MLGLLRQLVKGVVSFSALGMLGCNKIIRGMGIVIVPKISVIRFVRVIIVRIASILTLTLLSLSGIIGLLGLLDCMLLQLFSSQEQYSKRFISAIGVVMVLDI